MRTTIVTIFLLTIVNSAEGVEYQANDVRPWQAYLDAKRAIPTARLSEATDAPPFMIGRLGPLPWRFEPTEATPFKTIAVVKRMYTRIENSGGPDKIVARVEITYPETREALKAEDQAIFISIQNVRPQDDSSKYRWSAPGGYHYR